MTLPVVRSPQAEEDLTQIADFLAQRRVHTALRFLEAAQISFTRLAENPELGGRYESRNPKLAGLRVWPVKGFPSYLLFYRLGETRIEVVRILHGVRDLEHLDN